MLSYADSMVAARSSHPGFYGKAVIRQWRIVVSVPQLSRFSIQGHDGATYHVITKANVRLRKNGSLYAEAWSVEGYAKDALLAAHRDWVSAGMPAEFEWVDVDGGRAYR